MPVEPGRVRRAHQGEPVGWVSGDCYGLSGDIIASRRGRVHIQLLGAPLTASLYAHTICA